MAGGVCKSVGLVFLVLGAVGALVGAGLALTGFLQERSNQDQRGLFAQPDRDQSEMNAAMLAAGGVSFLAGLASLTVGGVLLGVGSARQNRALVNAILVKGAPPQA